MMQRLRSIHLYLGCIFGPLLFYFAVSGIWQTLKLHLAPDGSGKLAVLSTIHTSRALKTSGISTLSSPLLEAFVIAMAVGLMITAIIGVVMAFRFGRRRGVVIGSLAAGVLLPLLLITLSWLG